MSGPTDSLASRQIYARIVADHVGPLLRQHSFASAADDWFLRWLGDTLWRVSCSFRRVRNRDEGWLVVHVCVGFRPLEVFLAPCEVVSRADIARPCAMGTDLGHLRPPYNYHEWHLLAVSEGDLTGLEIVEEIRRYALPFFEKYGTLDKCVIAWESEIVYNLGTSVDFYLPAAYWLRGERERALGYVRDKIKHYDRLCEEKGRRQDFNTRESRETFLNFLESNL